jgi:transcriptional regulator with XRE-family HTH domain
MSSDSINLKLKEAIKSCTPRVVVVDKIVANKIREHRISRRMSQKRLGRIIGVSIQQIQKYENGINRVSAGKLYVLAKEFNIPVAQFFEFSIDDDKINEIPVNNKEIKMLELLKQYFKELPDNQQQKLLQLVKTMAEDEQKKKKERKDETGRTE